VADLTGAAVNHERPLAVLDPQVARELKVVTSDLLDEALGVPWIVGASKEQKRETKKLMSPPAAETGARANAVVRLASPCLKVRGAYAHARLRAKLWREQNGRNARMLRPREARGMTREDG
jgi:hypothetical protein